jgi:DNA-binding PadR family transcriptional regulator
MSVKAMTYVWDYSPYNGNALIVHLALADHCDDQGICWPSQKYLANKCKVSERQIRRIISQMVLDGFLFVEVRGREGKNNNRYRLLYKKVQDTGDLLDNHNDAIWPVQQDIAVSCPTGQAGGLYNHHKPSITTNRKNPPPKEIQELIDKLRKSK